MQATNISLELDKDMTRNQTVKNLPANAEVVRDMDLIPGLG